MSRWRGFDKKYLGKIEKWMSWFFSIASLILSICAILRKEDNIGWKVILAIIVFNSIYQIIIAVYETLIFKRGIKIHQELEEHYLMQIQDKNKKIEINKTFLIKTNYYYKYIIGTLNKFSTQLLYVNTNYHEEKKHWEALEKIDKKEKKEELKSLTEEIKAKADLDYRKNMQSEFDHFLGNITSKLKEYLDVSLSDKGSLCETSIAVKQFSRIVCDPNDVADVKIITTFRDNHTYSQGKREIGENVYTVSKNTDFGYCLRNRYFLKNNITDSDKTYENEHNGFLEFYNCTIVAPIFCQYPSSRHVFGYLTCDILNYNFEQTDLLDEQMAEVMVTTANVIGIYFDNLDYQWEHNLEDDFLDIVFRMKHPQTNGGKS